MSDELLKQLIGEINGMRKDIKDLNDKMYEMPCKEHKVKTDIMWKGFWALLFGQASLFFKIVVDYFSRGQH